MIKAFKSGRALYDEIESVQANPDQLDIWWLGQSGYLIAFNGKRLLIDPYLSDSLTKKYRNTDKPHVRMSEIAIDPHLLHSIHWVTSSHIHTDHLDAETLKPIFANNPEAKFIFPVSIYQTALDRSQCDEDYMFGLDIGSHYKDDTIEIIAVPAAHEKMDKDPRGYALYLGYIIKIGHWTLYHSGDTIHFDGMEDILSSYHIDLSFLPINGADPTRKVSGNLNAQEAVDLAKSIKTKWTIPGHYDMFEFNTADPAEFEKFARQEGIDFRILRLGERFSLTL